MKPFFLATKRRRIRKNRDDEAFFLDRINKIYRIFVTELLRGLCDSPLSTHYYLPERSERQGGGQLAQKERLDTSIARRAMSGH